MPAVSRAQFRLMQAAAHGGARNISISPAKAKEFVSGQSPKGLPERVSRKKRPVKYSSPVDADNDND